MQAAWAKNKIDGVRIWPSPNNTRIVFDLADSPKFSYFSLSNPERLVVDFESTKNQFDFKNLNNNSKLLKKIREFINHPSYT